MELFALVCSRDSSAAAVTLQHRRSAHAIRRTLKHRHSFLPWLLTFFSCCALRCACQHLQVVRSACVTPDGGTNRDARGNGWWIRDLSAGYEHNADGGLLPLPYLLSGFAFHHYPHQRLGDRSLLPVP
jgi:hypothetical protein